ncbi:hypothetical protein L596_018858 [Steinernema carpocapsae]|uniref:Uncharacterized protein n=1 Tax=Steinernema carpocapsae TaxID=34508 RepID=A0A4U5N5W6_STECR|nr:hypothetical protein L596_018858 [Steinernema carpocapsae]
MPTLRRIGFEKRRRSEWIRGHRLPYPHYHAFLVPTRRCPLSSPTIRYFPTNRQNSFRGLMEFVIQASDTVFFLRAVDGGGDGY